jgi:hypothetical protein
MVRVIAQSGRCALLGRERSFTDHPMWWRIVRRERPMMAATGEADAVSKEADPLS